MGKARITYEIIAGILSLCTVGGTTVMCVPSTQTKIADYTAENLSPKYAQTVELTKEQQNKIKNLEFELDENGKILVKAQADLDTANKSIKERDATIQGLNEDLDTANGLILDKDGKITSLQNEKTTLTNEITSLTKKKAEVQEQYEQGLITIAERDATITDLNSQIDSKNTLIEEKDNKIVLLQNEKQLLNSQVEELTTQKTQLETEIASLTNTKNSLEEQISQLTTENANLQKQVEDLQERLKLSEETAEVKFNRASFSFYNTYIPSTKISAEEWTYTSEYISNLFSIHSYSSLSRETYLDISYDGHSVLGVYSESIAINSFMYFHNGESITYENYSSLLNTLSNSKDRTDARILLKYEDNSLVVMIDLVDRFLTGKYIDKSGRTIDFDNNQVNGFGDKQGEIYICSSSIGYFLCIGNTQLANSFSFIDDNTICLDDVLFYKEGTQPTAGIPTADNVKCEVMGQNETDQYTIIFNENDKYLKITNLADISNVQQITIEFVSFDLESKLLTFKRVDTNENIVLTVQTFVDTGAIYGIGSATYNDVLLGC